METYLPWDGVSAPFPGQR